MAKIIMANGETKDVTPAKDTPFQYYHTKCLPENHKIDGRDVRFADLMDNTACAVCNEAI